ncbi:MAG: cysteine--tRNA ligase [Bdellovibrionota bacterium]
MSLKVYNSLTRKKEEFIPRLPPKVTMYVCGPTVYNFLHVGNFRVYVVFNLVRNWLEAQHNYQVTYAVNFTDVDDRIIEQANKDKKTAEEISEKYIAEYKIDLKALGLRPHDLNPKVTETMPEILQLTEDLIQKKKAYAAEGDVLFAIDSFPTYGKLSGRDPQDMIAGSRVEVDQKKKNPLDFALWKSAKPGEPSWPSPWGAGRPGWHIECSAMVFKHFGEQIDIHGGGMDLLFPHHENEIAQSEAGSGKTFSRYWMHNNMLNLSGQKMSKSLGNFVTIRDFLKTHPAEVYKWMILSVHYRSICDFGDEAVHRAIAGLAKVYSAMAVAESYGAWDSKVTDPAFEKTVETCWKKVVESLDDDFNTPEAFAALYEMIRQFNTQVKRGIKPTPVLLAKSVSFKMFVQKIGHPMSLFQEKPSEFLRKLDDLLLQKMNLQRDHVDGMVAERTQSRIEKNFKKSDELRDKLLALGISVSDSVDGTHWEVLK